MKKAKNWWFYVDLKRNKIKTLNKARKIKAPGEELSQLKIPRNKLQKIDGVIWI